MRRHFTLLLAALTFVHVAEGTPPINVALKSSWAASPVHETILETVSLEYPHKFFNFLDQLSDASSNAGYENVLNLAFASGIIEDMEALARIKMNLGLYSAIPKLEAFYNFYESTRSEGSLAGCDSWVDWYGTYACDTKSLAYLVDKELVNISAGFSPTPPRPKLLAFDHIHPPLHKFMTRPPLTAILYGTLSSPTFRDLHSYLLERANASYPHIEYVFRPIRGREMRPGHDLTGYGVALDLKKMDYLALDDRNQDGATSRVASEHRRGENVDPILSLILAHREDSLVSDPNTPLTPDEISELGSQAVQIISSSPTPLDTLIHLSQNFPKYATSLSRRTVANSSVLNELQKNALNVQKGFNMFWLNGLSVDLKDINPFSLLRLLKKERDTVSYLVSLGMSRKQAFELLTHSELATKQRKSDFDTIFDASDRVEGGGAIVWWNDIERDSRYKNWRPSLHELMRAMYSGAIPSARLNLFNVVLVTDLSQVQAMKLLLGPVATIIERNVPLRIGVVPSVESEDGKKMAQLLYHFVGKFGRKKTLDFLQLILQLNPEQSATIDWNAAKQAYQEFIESLQDDNLDPYSNFETIVETNSESIDKAAAYANRLGCTFPQSFSGHAFFNGKYLSINDDILRSIQAELNLQLNFFREQLYQGTLSDENKPEQMENYFYDMPSTNKRRNAYIYPSQTQDDLKLSNIPALFNKIGFKVPASYVYPPVSVQILQSLIVIADFDTNDGIDLAKESLLSLTPESSMRITFLHNSVKSHVDDFDRPPVSWLMSHLYMRDLFPQDASPLLAFLGGPVLPNEAAQTSVKNAFEGLTGVALDEMAAEEYSDYVKHGQLLAREFGLLPGQMGLVINGRIVGPIDLATKGSFLAVDFHALEAYELSSRSEPVSKALHDIVPDLLQDKHLAPDVISMATSIIASGQQPDPSEVGLFNNPSRARQRNYELLDKEYTSFEIGDASTALYHVAMLVDPLSEQGQKWSSIIQWLTTLPDIHVEVHLNPGRYEELPLKRFYRYNLPTENPFTSDQNHSIISFEDLPIDPIYTLAVDVPSSWLVRPREALYDLDNIQLGHLFPGDESVEAVFALDYIVVEGHAREISSKGEPPRGVQLELSRSDGTAIDDTQVVANLGYFQFKAKPGVFHLDIRRGRGQDIFKLDSAGNEGWNSPSVEVAGNEITITSFEGLTLYPRLSRIPGKETADVLSDDNDEGGSHGSLAALKGYVSWLKLKLTGNREKEQSKAVATSEAQSTINIFTVASGLLYERFVGIMILSVLRNTNSTVKFWFIENFLSPAFLEFIPHMAEKYNFQYELVTYKWPSWLRAQTEKQRVIWAYKILFLDVLFPMDLKKVIFVDADQIIRTDLKELVDLDLHGAPYGYTPMGDDNTDMEGFRFWKVGYWAQVLRGKPYHISALYVIDLQRFRQLAAGDILRGHYHQLSADRNSLSNLDQDLPNNLQDQVPIYSLHEDWLWCETWCSKERLHRAKTIDLCQNPLTKEPKLARARQIPEWEQYDTEIAQFTRELAMLGKIHSRMATADTNVLAGGVGSMSAEVATGHGKEGELLKAKDGVENSRDEL